MNIGREIRRFITEPLRSPVPPKRSPPPREPAPRKREKEKEKV